MRKDNQNFKLTHYYYINYNNNVNKRIMISLSNRKTKKNDRFTVITYFITVTCAVKLGSPHISYFAIV